MLNAPIVHEQYALLMERFPRLALALPHLEQREMHSEVMPPFVIDSAACIYFYGLGSGEGYLYCADWLVADTTRRLVIIEEDLEQIASFLHLPIAKQLLHATQVQIVGPEEIDTVIAEHPVSNIDIFALPSKEGPHFEELKERILRKGLIAMSQHLDRLYGYQLFDNFLHNLKSLPYSFYANGLQGRFQGVPAFICGAGPSLQMAIPLLKTVERKALVIAGGSTLAALSAQGIAPHFGIAIDPNQEEVRRLKHHFAFEVPFLYSMRLYPEVFQTCSGPFGYMRSGIGGVLELWLEEALGYSGELIGQALDVEALSVTSIACAWASILGCNPIFLAGVDLAYTRNQRYVSGVYPSPGASSGEIGVDRKVRKLGRGGEIVETAIRWVMESAVFSRFARKHPETSFFTLSQEGLGFEAISYCSPMEAIGYLDREWDLRKQVADEILRVPIRSGDVIRDKIEALWSSLQRVLHSLEILAGEKQGIAVLEELELREELAYSLLFFDAEQILMRERQLQGEERKPWAHFLDHARKYQLIFENWKQFGTL